eukprot:6103790-Amphidinium_carterae.1
MSSPVRPNVSTALSSARAQTLDRPRIGPPTPGQDLTPDLLKPPQRPPKVKMRKKWGNTQK